MRARDLGSFLYGLDFVVGLFLSSNFWNNCCGKDCVHVPMRCSTSYSPSCTLCHINALIFDAYQRLACVAGGIRLP